MGFPKPQLRAIQRVKWQVGIAIVAIGFLGFLQLLMKDVAPHGIVASISRKLLDDGGNSTCVNPGAQPDPCSFVMENCGDVPSYINYLEIHYCYLGRVPGVSFTLMVTDSAC